MRISYRAIVAELEDTLTLGGNLHPDRAARNIVNRALTPTARAQELGL